jgi:hypothetical protein
MSIRPSVAKVVSNEPVSFKPEFQAQLQTSAHVEESQMSSAKISEIANKLNTLQAQIEVSSGDVKTKAEQKASVTSLNSESSVSIDSLHARLQKLEAVHNEGLLQIKDKLEQVQSCIDPDRFDGHMNQQDFEKFKRDVHIRLGQMEDLHVRHNDEINHLFNNTVMNAQDMQVLDRIKSKLQALEAQHYGSDSMRQRNGSSMCRSCDTQRRFVPLAGEYDEHDDYDMPVRRRDLASTSSRVDEMSTEEIRNRIEKLETLKSKILADM